jgi:hypothetical protein
VIAILGKPSGERTQAELLRRLARCPKPAVVCLLGATSEALVSAATAAPKLGFARTIDEAAEQCLRAVDLGRPRDLSPLEPDLTRIVADEVGRMSPSQRYVRGIFAGGTFCYQAQAVARDAGLQAWSNAPLRGMGQLGDPMASREHSFLDMGAEELVQGRAHPMIDATLRRRRVEAEALDPEAAILLLDFILGSVSSPDPAGDLVPSIARGRELAERQGRHLMLVASVCGTELDPQGIDSQERKLRATGVLVAPSAAQAARIAVQAALALGRQR